MGVVVHREGAQLGGPVSSHLVPVAVMLRGGAVVLQDFGDCALIDALEVQLPLPEFQETPGREKQAPLCCPLLKGE